MIELRPELAEIRDRFSKEDMHNFLIGEGFKLEVVPYRTKVGEKIKCSLDKRPSYIWYYPVYYKEKYGMHARRYRSEEITLAPGHTATGLSGLTREETLALFHKLLEPINCEFVPGEDTYSEAVGAALEYAKRLL